MYANPALYDQANYLQARDCNELVKRIKADLEEQHRTKNNNNNDGSSPAPLTLLDIGCGTGNETEKLYQNLQPLEQIVAFDISSEMIEFAQKRNNASIPSGKIRYVEADASEPFDSLSRKLNLAECSVDLVVSIYCLHWITDQRAVMDNIHRLLKPSGKMYLVLSTWNDLFPIQHKIIENNRWRTFLLEAAAKLEARQKANNKVAPLAPGQTAPQIAIKSNELNADNCNQQSDDQSKPRRKFSNFEVENRPSEESMYRIWDHLCFDSRLILLEMNFNYCYYPFNSIKQFNDLVQAVCYWLSYIPVEMHQDFLKDYFDHVHQNYTNRQIEKQKQWYEKITGGKKLPPESTEAGTVNLDNTTKLPGMELFRFYYNYATIVGTKTTLE